MTAYALYEGSYSVDSSKTFLPFDPAVHNRSDRKGSLFIHVHPFLIDTGDDLVLLDTGLGFKDEAGNLTLHNNIRKAGFEPENITLVLQSHLHQDHASGMVEEKSGSLRLAFPDAEYVIQRGEWEEGYSGKSGSYKTAVFDVLQRSGNLHLVEGDGQLNKDISYELSGGHTEFHQVFHVLAAGEHFFFGGDVLPEPEQLLRRFAAKYDYDGHRSMELRQQYGEQAVAENWTCLFYHSTNIAIGKVHMANEGFKIVPAP